MPRSYKKLWHQKIAFTGVGDRKIPLLEVVYLDDVIVFLVSLPIVWVLNAFTPIALLDFIAPSWAVIPILSLTMVYATRKLDPAGKSLPKYLWSAFRYLFRGHLYRGASPLPRGRRWKKGRVHHVRSRGRVAWTTGHLPVPVRVKGREFEFTLHERLDLEFRRDGLSFHPASRLHLPSKKRWYAVKSGTYQYKDGKLTPRR